MVYPSSPKFSLAQILAWTHGRLVNSSELNEASDQIWVSHLAPLPGAGENDVAFYHSKAFFEELKSSEPRILMTNEASVEILSTLSVWSKASIVTCQDPYFAMAVLSEKFAAHQSSVAHLDLKNQLGSIHPTAVVDPSVEMGPHVTIGPYCVIEGGVKIGAHSVLYSHCVVGQRARIGESCVLFSHVTVYEWTEMGSRVRLHSGVVLGADGFGYAPERQGRRIIRHQKIFHLGRVVLGDDVEVGSNTCIDRGTFGDTRVGSGAKIDNLVQVGHNVTIDEGAILCGGVCLAGNVHIGKFAYVGGVTGISNHVRIGDGALIGACSLISKDVPSGTKSLGNPQRSYQEHFRVHAWLNRRVSRRGETHDGK